MHHTEVSIFRQSNRRVAKKGGESKERWNSARAVSGYRLAVRLSPVSKSGRKTILGVAYRTPAIVPEVTENTEIGKNSATKKRRKT